MTISTASYGSFVKIPLRGLALAQTDVTMDSSYPTGGETVTAAQLGLTSIEAAWAAVKTVSGTVNIANVFCNVASTKDSVNIVVYDETPAEVTDTGSLASVVFRIFAVGR